MRLVLTILPFFKLEGASVFLRTSWKGVYIDEKYNGQTAGDDRQTNTVCDARRSFVERASFVLKLNRLIILRKELEMVHEIRVLPVNRRIETDVPD